MGIFSNRKKERKIEQSISEYFEMINAYTPAFRSFEGSVYEMELTRAAIHAFATQCSKLKPEVIGPAQGNKALERRLQFAPNALMDTKKYLYRLATIYKVTNNAFIAPLYDEFDSQIVGFYPLHPDKCELVSYNGKMYLRYDFANGEKASIEFERLGRLTQFQNKDELYGEGNKAFRPTLEMLNSQNQAIIEGTKNSASIRFLGMLSQVLRPDDIVKEQKRLRKDSLGADNSGGIMLFDAKYKDVKQIQSAPLYVDDKQMQLIRENVFYYFGTNEKILKNSYNSDEWQAYYEGEIEPFALETSLVHTNLRFTPNQIAYGNNIMFTSNRLQYLSSNEKLNTITQLFDRGFLTHNQGLEILNLPGIGEEGDKRFIRKEYALSEYNGGFENANQNAGAAIPLDEPAQSGDGAGQGQEI